MAVFERRHEKYRRVELEKDELNMFPITTTAEYAPSYLQHAVRCQRMKSSKNPATQISAHAGNTDFRVYHHAVDVVERTVIIDLPDKNGVEVPVIVNWIVT